ncbi:hypothetical protein AMECASPLE_039597 [Ameca splendens]|uniref:Uncharacterized protein n=1 Tax=Ameca splendens TaxID=208324 RepID=A0ABV0YJP6_9TELE
MVTKRKCTRLSHLCPLNTWFPSLSDWKDFSRFSRCKKPNKTWQDLRVFITSSLYHTTLLKSLVNTVYSVPAATSGEHVPLLPSCRISLTGFTVFSICSETHGSISVTWVIFLCIFLASFVSNC